MVFHQSERKKVAVQVIVGGGITNANVVVGVAVRCRVVAVVMVVMRCVRRVVCVVVGIVVVV